MNLLKNLKKTTTTASRNGSSHKRKHTLFSSLTSSTAVGAAAAAAASASQPHPQRHKSQGTSELLGNMIFYNIVILEAMKTPLTAKQAPSSNSADCEHIAHHSLSFLILILDFFHDDLLLIRVEAGSHRVLDFLKGPYLAQLIQSCLQLSQHRYVTDIWQLFQKELCALYVINGLTCLLAMWLVVILF